MLCTLQESQEAIQTVGFRHRVQKFGAVPGMRRQSRTDSEDRVRNCSLHSSSQVFLLSLLFKGKNICIIWKVVMCGFRSGCQNWGQSWTWKGVVGSSGLWSESGGQSWMWRMVMESWGSGSPELNVKNGDGELGGQDLKSWMWRMVMESWGSGSQSWMLRMVLESWGSGSQSWMLRMVFESWGSGSQSWMWRMVMESWGSGSRVECEEWWWRAGGQDLKLGSELNLKNGSGECGTNRLVCCFKALVLWSTLMELISWLVALQYWFISSMAALTCVECWWSWLTYAT